MINMEIWKEIKDYDGKYYVSNLGRIKSMPNKSWSTERILKPVNQTYSFIDLCKDAKVKKLTIHRIVAIAFIENPLNKPEVNHINGNKHDNRVENLEWVTKSENQLHAIKSGLRTCKGIKNSQCKLNEKKVIDIYTSKMCTKDLSIKHNISMATICDIRNNRSWVHITKNINLG